MPTEIKVNPSFNANELVRRFAYFSEKLVETLYEGDEEVIKRLDGIKFTFDKVASFAHEYDYNGIQANGYWSFMRSCCSLFMFAMNNYRKQPKFDENFKLIINALSFWVEALEEHRRLSSKRTGKPLYGIKPIEVEDLEEAYFGSKEIIIAYLSVAGYNMSPDMGRSIKSGLNIVTAHTWRRAFDLMKWALSSRVRADTMAQVLQRMDCDFMKAYHNVSEYKFVNKFLVKMNNLTEQPQMCQTMYFDLDTKWKLNIIDGKDIAIKRSKNRRKRTGLTRCRLIRHGSEASTINNNNVYKGLSGLLIHCHGGAFISQSPDSHEVYLQNWAVKLPGITIISVDYVLSPEHKFPEALQQLLDLYLWLTSGDPIVEKTIGLTPNRVALAGDSAGANLITSLTLVLNDLRRQNQRQVILMPTALLNFYPILSLKMEFSPSFLQSPFDGVLNPSSIINSNAAYLPKREHRMDGTIVPLVRLNDASNFSSGERNRSVLIDEDTYEENRRHLRQQMADLQSNRLICHPYVSPLFYKHFDTLTDVSLYLLPTYFCPLLDHSIEMAKKWKGDVHLDVLDNITHGCLNLCMLSNEAQAAVNLGSQRLQQIFFATFLNEPN